MAGSPISPPITTAPILKFFRHFPVSYEGTILSSPCVTIVAVSDARWNSDTWLFDHVSNTITSSLTETSQRSCRMAFTTLPRLSWFTRFLNKVDSLPTLFTPKIKYSIQLIQLHISCLLYSQSSLSQSSRIIVKSAARFEREK